LSDDVVIELHPARNAFIRASSLNEIPPAPRDWHMEGWIPGRTVTLLSGDGGVGKSTLALQLAVSTAAARPWLGSTPKPGPVIYVSAEDDQDELHRRLDEICTGHGIGLDSLADLHLWDLTNDDATMAVEGRDGGIEPTDRWATLVGLAGELNPVLIILDSLADIYGGNENIRPQVRQFVALLRRLAIKEGLAVLVLAHPSNHGIGTGSGVSGSTAWNNSVRSRIYFTRPSGDDVDPDLRLLSQKKSNYSRAQADLRLRRQMGGFALEDGGRASGPLDVAIERRRIDALFLHLLDAYTAQGRTVSDRPGANFAPAVFAKDGLARGCTKAGFTVAMNRLMHAGEVRVEQVGRPSRPLRQVVRATREGAPSDA